jgi:hypothetical protein
MTARGCTRAGLAALVLWVGACSDDSRDPLAPPSGPSASHTGIPDITGAILGPDGTSICNSVPAGSAFSVHALDAVNLFVAAFQDVTCPEFTYAIPVEPGSYFVRAEFITFDGIDGFPFRNLAPGPVTVEANNVEQDVQIKEGTRLGGRVAVDGEPISDVSMFVQYVTPPGGFNAAFPFSGPDGTWRDFFDRDPLSLILQNDLAYQVGTECFLVLGAVVLEDAPVDPFIFPTERSSVDCRLTAGPTLELTHNFNRIAVTALPGNIGGSGFSALPDFGTGYGVQFPLARGQAPAHGPHNLSQLFDGGLLIGIAPSTVLSGSFVGGTMDCPFELENACRDLGLDGRVHVTESPVLGKTITWRYTDAASAEAVGLRVTQRSYDAPAGNDYVLFRFTIQNRSHGTRTFSPGLFTDWDIDFDAFDDRGFVQQDGRLMYQSNLFEEATTRAGTLMVGETASSPGFFFAGFAPPPTTGEQVAALTGELSAPPLPPEEPADLRYIQGVSPVTLKHGKSTDLWVAVIAGENEAAFLATAEAAARDIETHRRIPESVAERGSQRALSHSLVRAGASQPVRRPVCMKDCLRELKERRGLNLRIGGR